MHDASEWLAEDYYDYFLQRRALSNTSEVIAKDNFFWGNIIEHPNYDTYRQERDWIQYLTKTQCQTMIVGGWNDEQNAVIAHILKHLKQKEALQDGIQPHELLPERAPPVLRLFD